MSHMLPRLNPAAYPYANLGPDYFRIGGEFCKYHGYMIQRGSYSFPDIMKDMLGAPPKTVCRMAVSWRKEYVMLTLSHVFSATFPPG